MLQDLKEYKVLLVLKVSKVLRVDYQHMQFLREELLFGLEQLMLFHQDGHYVMVRTARQT